MSNEPVAIVKLGGDIEWLTDVLPYNAKLYTHPAKTLTERIAELEQQVGIWEKEAMQARIHTALYKSEINELRKDLSKYDRLAWDDLNTHPAKTLPERLAELEKCAEYYRDKYYFDSLTKTLTDEEILTTIKCIADDVSPHKEYENTYSDGWIDACNTIYDEVFAILRKAQEK
jgi:hypothetical protein